VFIGVYANGLSGSIASDLAKKVNRTWEISPTVQTGISAIIKLQWNASDEGATFATSHSSAFMSKNRHTSGDNTWIQQASSLVTGSNPYSLSNSSAISTFSTFDVGTTTALPIELLTFNVVTSKGFAKINWSTLTETNNDYFTVERSTDGVNWEEIYTCKAAGTTTIEQHYSCLDAEKQTSSKSYYRIKQTDFNGVFTYSPIESIDNYTAIPSIKIFPNPFDGRSLYLSGLNEKLYSITIYNAFGKKVYSTSIKLDGEVTVILDLDEQLIPGYYILHCTSANQSFSQLLLAE
jgi:hypothetical protein